MNGPVEILRTLGDRLQTSASVKSVFGDPITVGDKTVIPVARIRYGMGAGGGSFSRDNSSGSDTPSGKSGGGGGGGIIASPKGVLEVSPAGTRFIAFADRKRLSVAVAAGFLFGVAFGWRRSRRQIFFGRK
ncbi:MAG: spore germination protein GerW family protein [Candidatus Korobacteraceae bacterium]